MLLPSGRTPVLAEPFQHTITMVMTDAMEEVMYDYKNFNFDLHEGRHPLWVTDKHFVYHLAKDWNDELVCRRTATGDLVSSPRWVLWVQLALGG